jgi:hypothetical protein
MPILVNGQGYRDAVANLYEASTVAEVRKIRNPVDKSYAMVAPANGASFNLFKFDINSTAADDGTDVLLPNNPFYSVSTDRPNASGRWIITVSSADFGGGGGGGGGDNFFGNGSPEGVIAGSRGNTYWDIAGQSLWIKNSGTGTDTGWVQLVTI